MEETFLNDLWSIYFHDPYDEKWTYDSYKRLATVGSVEAFWEVHEKLKDKIHAGMFFVMREHIFPCWDDENNKKGGCLSIKVLKQDMKEFWEYLCVRLLGESFIKEEHRVLNWSKVNGISTSPKKHFCIVKVWLADGELINANCFDIPSNHHGDILYRSNLENIENNNQTTCITSPNANDHSHKKK